MSDPPVSAPAFDGVVGLTGDIDHVLGGLRLLERAAFALVRSGARRLLFIGRRPHVPLRLPDVPLAWHDGTCLVPSTWWDDASPTIVVMNATTVADPASIVALAAASTSAGLAAPRPAVLWGVDAARLRALVDSDVVGPALEPPVAMPSWRSPPGGLVCVAGDGASRTAAESALFARLGRPGDGWFTRVVDRRLSRALTRLLLPTGIAPNQVTIASIVIGILSGWCFARGTPSAAIVGALLFLASTIIDGCDGEIARLTFRESAFGARLDILGDNVVHLFLFAGIATGLYRRSADPALALLGTALIVGVLLAMGTVYLYIVRRSPNAAQRALFEAFASREFAYLLVLMTVVGRLDWFLWLSAVGTYAFAIGLVALASRSSS